MYIILSKFNAAFKNHLDSSELIQAKSKEPYVIYQVDMTYLQHKKLSKEDMNKIESHINHAKSLDENALIHFVGEKHHYDELYKHLIEIFNKDASIGFIVG